jgi:hypothetical protein
MKTGGGSIAGCGEYTCYFQRRQRAAKRTREYVRRSQARYDHVRLQSLGALVGVGKTEGNAGRLDRRRASTAPSRRSTPPGRRLRTTQSRDAPTSRRVHDHHVLHGSAPESVVPVWVVLCWCIGAGSRISTCRVGPRCFGRSIQADAFWTACRGWRGTSAYWRVRAWSQ